MSKKIFASNDKTKFAFVDDDVFDVIQQMDLKFCIHKCTGYFYSTSHNIQLPGMIKKKPLQLHRFVWILKTRTEPSLTIDHIDRQPTNNQFSNLRLATKREQVQNQGKRKDNTSGYIGVCHQHRVDKRRKKNNVHDYWIMSIMDQNGKREVKHFPYTEAGKLAAARWYDSKAKQYFGEFHGQLNFPMPSDKDK